MQPHDTCRRRGGGENDGSSGLFDQWVPVFFFFPRKLNAKQRILGGRLGSSFVDFSPIAIPGENRQDRVVDLR